MTFKDISYLQLWGPFVQQSRTICAILTEGIKGNIYVKYFQIWTDGSGGDGV